VVRWRSGLEEPIARLGAGSCHGEMSALTGRPVTVTVRAATPVRAAVFAKDTLLEALDVAPRLGSNLAVMMMERLQGHLGRRLARTALVVLDPRGGDGGLETAQRLLSAVGRMRSRSVIADFSDRLCMIHARGRPTLAALAAHPEQSAAIEAELSSSGPAFWVLRRGSPVSDPCDLFPALRLLGQFSDQLLALADPAEAERLLARDAEYFQTVVWLTPSPGSALPAFLASPAGSARPLHLLLAGGSAPRNLGDMRDQDLRLAGKVFVDVPGTQLVRGIEALARDLCAQRIGIALGGGAARGFAHIGALQRLRELGVPIDALCGSSSGAALGSLWSFGYEPDRIAGLFAQVQTHGVRWTLPTRSLLSGASLERLLHIAGEGNGFDQARFPLGVVVVDLYAGCERLCTSGDLTRCVLASCAIPGIYPPVKLDGRWSVDGGVLHPVPAGFVRALGADVVIAVDLAGSGGGRQQIAPPRRGPHLLDVLRLSADLMHARITEHSREGASLILRPVGPGPAPGVADYEQAGGWREYGREAVDRALPELQALLPWLGVDRDEQ
jgi:NTE family protein